MAVAFSNVVKPERMAETALAAIEDSLVLPNLVQHEGIDKFAGSANDTVNIKVDGVLPAHKYGWRNDRTNPIKFDAYSDRTTSISFGGDVYSAVALIDEQIKMDGLGWDKLAVKQGEAVGRQIEREVLEIMTGFEYDVEVTLDMTDPRKALVYLRKVFNSLNIEGTRRIAAGADFEEALLTSDLTLASVSGDSVAEQALREAIIGKLYGFTFVSANEVGNSTAYGFIESGFVVVSGAPNVPLSVANGATASANGYATRWITDYDAAHLNDRSVVNTYIGGRGIKDPVLTYAADADGLQQAVVSTKEYGIRQVKINVTETGGNSVEVADATLAKFMNMTGQATLLG